MIRVSVASRAHVHVAGIFPVAREFAINAENEDEARRRCGGGDEFVGEKRDERSRMKHRIGVLRRLRRRSEVEGFAQFCQ